MPADPVHFGYGATYLGVASYHGARTWSLRHRAYVGVFCLGLRAGLSKLQVSSLGYASGGIDSGPEFRGLPKP